MFRLGHVLEGLSRRHNRSCRTVLEKSIWIYRWRRASVQVLSNLTDFWGMDGWTQTKCRNCTCTCYCYACRGVRRLRERRELIVRWCHSECIWRVLNPLIPKVSKSLVPLGIRFQIWITFLTQRLQAGTAFRKQLSTSAYCTNMGGSSGMQKVSRSAKNPGFSRLSFECLHGFRRGKNGKQMWICGSRPSSQMRRLVLWHQTSSFYQRQTIFSGYINYGDWGADMPGFFEGYLTFGQARIRSSHSVPRTWCFSIFRFRARSTRSLKSGSSCVFQALCVHICICAVFSIV